MKAILLPVKEFRQAKKRLAPHFSEKIRAELAAALCEDMFATIGKLRGNPRVFVASSETQALRLARTYGWETIEETAQLSESQSVDTASRHCTSLGVTMLLRLPIDIPLAEPADIEAVLDAAEPAPSMVVVASRDGTGTNALLRSPPDLFPSHFGPGSFLRHLAEAHRCSARIKILTNPRIAIDIDERDDFTPLAGLLRPSSATSRWMERYRP